MEPSEPLCHIEKTFRVGVVLALPCAALKEDYQSYTGNGQFEGLCIDVLKEVSTLCGFNYTIAASKDNKYGIKENNGQWNGLVGELLRGEIDLIASDLEVTLERSYAVDFTAPYTFEGLGFLFKKPKLYEPSVFSFLLPFDASVWCSIFFAIIISAICLYLTKRLQRPNQQHGDDVQTNFNMGNSFWFMLVSLLCQGTSLEPQSLSARILSTTWWFFAMIVLASYTGNLAAFLTVQRLVVPIDSFSALSMQTHISYGVVDGSGVMLFFKNSKTDPYQQMWAYMSARPSVFVENVSDGAIRAQQGDYAYIAYRGTLEYYANTNCDLVMVDGHSGTMAGAMALPKGSPYKEMLSNAILALQDNNRLFSLEKLWYKNKGHGGNCDKDPGDNASLNMHDLSGLFIVLAIGLFVALSLAMWDRYRPIKCEYITPTSSAMLSRIWRQVDTEAMPEKVITLKVEHGFITTVQPDALCSSP